MRNYDDALVLDLETTFSMKKAIKQGNEVEVSDIGSPFNPLNRVVEIGAYDPQSRNYYEFSVERGDSLEPLRELLVSKKRIIGHNIKYDCHWLKKIGMPVDHLTQEDTLVREYILRGGKHTYAHLGLDKLAPKYGGTNKLDAMKMLWKKGINTNEIPYFIRSPYLKMDVWNTWKIYMGQERHPLREQFDAMLRFKADLNGAVQRMEYNGIPVCKNKALEIRTEFKRLICEAEFELYNKIEKALDKVGVELVVLPDHEGEAKRLKELYKDKETHMCVNAGSAKEMSKLMYGLEFRPISSYMEEVRGEGSITIANICTKKLEELELRFEECRTAKQMENVQRLIGNEQERMNRRFFKLVEEESKRRYRENIDYWKANFKKARKQSQLDELIKKCMTKLPFGFGVKPFPDQHVIGKSGLSASKKAVEALLKKKQSKRAVEFMEAVTNVSKFKTWENLCINAILYNISDDGCVHAGFNVAGTISGRFSSSQPNMQNLPSAKKHGGLNNTRACVRSRWEDGLIVAIDYSQLELRYVMGLTNCRQGIEDYENNVDMHAATARDVYDAEHGAGAFDSLDKESYTFWRGEAKAVNFGLLYGANPKTDTETKLQNAFFSRYPEVAQWQEIVEASIKRLGYYESSVTGWRYNFKGATSDNFWRGYTSDGKGWRNRSKNIPIQGGGNEVIQAPTITIDRRLQQAPWGEECLMIGQVHDELLFDVREKHLDKLLELAYKEMESTDEIYKKYFKGVVGVPMVVEASKGKNWFEQKEIPR